MSWSAWAQLQVVLNGLGKRQLQIYHERVQSWTREAKQALPDEALLYLAHCAKERTDPNNPKLRAIIAQFTRPQDPAA